MVRKVLIATASFFACFVAIELYSQGQPLQRIQHILKLDQHSLRVVGGVPVWRSTLAKGAAMMNPPCLKSDDARPDVVLLGDSILYGVSIPLEKTLGPMLQQQMSEHFGRTVCMWNLSEPGFTFSNQEVVFREAVAQHKPKALVLEMWWNSTNSFIAFDETAYNFGFLKKDSNGYPDVGLPSDLNRFLFQHTALWKHISIGLATRENRSSTAIWEQFLQEKLEPFADWLHSEDIQLILVFATDMGTPFSAGRPMEDVAYQVVKGWAESRGISQLSFSDVFANEDVSEVSIDTCCHLSEYGTTLVSEALAPLVVEVLDQGVD